MITADKKCMRSSRARDMFYEHPFESPHLLVCGNKPNGTCILCRRLLTKMDKRQKSVAYLDGGVSANTSSKYANPVAAEPSGALEPALVHVDARARLLARLRSQKHKDMVEVGINVQRARVCHDFPSLLRRAHTLF